MKKQNIILFLAIVSLTLFNFKSFVLATKPQQITQNKPFIMPMDNSRIMIRIYEAVSNSYQSPQIVITGDGETKQIDLKPFKNGNIVENDKTIFKTITDYLQKGYKIESSISTGSIVAGQFAVTTYLLVKE
jgi:hypothetical protein